ncbi:rod shape-determining protein MreD [Agathobaculum sp.]|uniref:rod shape-determining protein MreD n=1 Tax=Agathobaculum sp. TaxID=2048138 RepID=UPI002A83B106|nr:rod shape-determining protein MreD [Agathobaculum sp.]MDY3618617.1 rod shape-determining protein MreD [Agathobaculum sp.]
MQREQVSIPKIILYILLLAVVFALQSSLSRSFVVRGFQLDLLPCFVAAAALLDGPAEGVIMGLAVGVFYDVGFIGVDGIYPIFFLIFGLIAGSMSRLTLSRNYLSMVLLTGAEMILLGLARFFAYLLPMKGASFPLVLQQVLGGALLSCIFCFIVYWPMSKISRRFDTR